jgi:putative polyketide hydroxylase
MLMDTTVLVIGGSLNGLTTALLLAHHGVPCIAVERHPDTTVQYKFRGMSPRSMEVYRSLGIEQEIREHRTGDQKGGEIARAKNLSSPDVQFQGRPWSDTSEFTAASAETCDQDVLEPILRKHAERLGADVRFDTELVDLTQTDREVIGRVRDRKTGEIQTIRAAYVVACDGVSGDTRERVGIGRHGPGVLQHWMNIIFEAELEPFLQGKRITSCFVTDINGAMVPREDRWLLSLQYSPERGEKPEDFDQARTESLVRRAAGRPDLAVKLFDARSWEVTAYVADRFSAGRVFILGDAAHTMPPTGGFGGNTGIHDAHNLAWKLALVTRGVASPALLDTYDSERRPVAEGTLAQALARLAAWFKDLGARLPPPAKIRDDNDVIFGQRYPSGAFIPEGNASDSVFEDARKPSGAPGTRAHHTFIQHAGRTVPLHDLVGKNFLLLAGRGGDGWESAAAAIARDLRVDLQTARGDADGVVLIRPDGVIAWRSNERPEHADRRLREVFQQLLRVG